MGANWGPFLVIIFFSSFSRIFYLFHTLPSDYIFTSSGVWATAILQRFGSEYVPLNLFKCKEEQFLVYSLPVYIGLYQPLLSREQVGFVACCAPQRKTELKKREQEGHTNRLTLTTIIYP